jgi:5-oxoprolinase (ATP-hydrolysing) subunit C
MSRLLIQASTPLCQLQDAGRFGVRHLGVTQGGAADWQSMTWANWLLGNGLQDPVIEVTLGGMSVHRPVRLHIGAGGRRPGGNRRWSSTQAVAVYRVAPGPDLEIYVQPLNGARAYLAAPGGLRRAAAYWAAVQR